MSDATALRAERLRDDPIAVRGRLTNASNVTLVADLGAGEDALEVVYKPTSGTRSLWDFDAPSLARHEVATYEVAAGAAAVAARELGDGSPLDDSASTPLVPLTVFRPDGPFGEGSVQAWIDVAEGADELVTVVTEDELREGWLVVFEAYDQLDRDVYVVHADDRRLRRMTLLDEITNNADRKGQHVLSGRDGAVYGVDHGLCFHPEPKLRTVLWGWAGTEYDDADVAWLRALDESVHDLAAAALAELLPRREIGALQQRLARAASRGSFREPPRGRSALPWPPL